MSHLCRSLPRRHSFGLSRNLSSPKNGKSVWRAKRLNVCVGGYLCRTFTLPCLTCSLETHDQTFVLFVTKKYLNKRIFTVNEKENTLTCCRASCIARWYEMAQSVASNPTLSSSLWINSESIFLGLKMSLILGYTSSFLSFTTEIQKTVSKSQKVTPLLEREAVNIEYDE